jgi:hypothetical protein
MAKRTRGKTRTARAEKPAISSNTSTAITKTKYVSVMTKAIASENVAASEKLSLMGIVDKAAENDHLHKGAFAWAKRLRKMTAAKRAEHLFHFHVYCRYEGWPDEALPLGDRDPAEEQAEQDAMYSAGEIEPIPAEAIPRGPRAMMADNDDPRPRFLRTGGVDPNPPADLMDDAKLDGKPH